MPMQMTGRFTTGPNKGKLWQIYPDPASKTGWTRKIWSKSDTSNGGKPAESFEDFDYGAAEVDTDEEDARVAQTQRVAATKAAKDAQDKADADAATEREAAARREAGRLLLQQQQSDRDESTRRYDKTLHETELTRKARAVEVKNALKEQQRQFNMNYGLDIIKTGSQMRGPENAFQGFSFARGVADAGYSPFVAALRPDGNTAYGGGTARSGAPVPLTVGTLAADITGQKAAGGGGTDAYGRPILSSDQQAQLSPIRSMFEGGLANSKQGQLENLTDGEMKALRSGGDYLGYDTDSEFQFWKRSRPGQRSGLAA